MSLRLERNGPEPVGTRPLIDWSVSQVYPVAGRERSLGAATPGLRPRACARLPPMPSLPRLRRSADESTSTRSRGRWLLALLALLAVGAIGFGVGYLVFDEPEGKVASRPAAAPQVIVEEVPAPGEPQPDAEASAAERIGFPAFATRNTTRVGGADPSEDAAGVALASYPSVGGVEGPQAAILAPAESWQAGLAAAPLTAEPVAAPLLLSTEKAVPEVTADALTALSPSGLEAEDGAQVIVVGGVSAPDGVEPLEIDGADPAEIANRLDRERGKLGGKEDPDHLLVVSSAEADAAFSMPAAAWAARSGDPILFVDGDEVPEATLAVIERHPKASIYALGPESAISAKALRKIERKGAKPTRIGADDPVESAIEFARFTDGTFGWNINDPGHGFVIANAERPADAAAAAPLSAGGKPGPLLVTDDAEAVPDALRGFLLDTEPGFVDDPSRAVYNHIWLLGNSRAISVAFQAQADELTKLVPVSGDTSGPSFGPDPGTPEAEGSAGAQGKAPKPDRDGGAG